MLTNGRSSWARMTKAFSKTDQQRSRRQYLHIGRVLLSGMMGLGPAHGDSLSSTTVLCVEPGDHGPLGVSRLYNFEQAATPALTHHGSFKVPQRGEEGDTARSWKDGCGRHRMPDFMFSGCTGRKGARRRICGHRLCLSEIYYARKGAARKRKEPTRRVSSRI
ncbi:hypothetical protein BDP81DRAFT_15201 [Colletotrichum phormii]|uniref:Uncharacterized protein n=1 Tax=Colletotrichum phormii TaxID=359342 RepID=A0AAJ0A7Q7_9PEZI|nr:uncharacterized protein BDP81DRAFT_15201 [Colletotrichum phormii]KAK1656080.1 hypothetical protein BDP81DRAFT_15201 [Colletotrichum phormii]